MAKRSKYDPETVDSVVDGTRQPDDAPPELRRVASLFAAAAEVPAAAAADPDFIASLAAAVRQTTVPALRRKPVLAKVLTVKAAVLAGVLALGATSAAAATNSLPDAAQHGVATAAKHVGINLPDSANDHARDASDDRGSDEHPTSTTVADHGKSGDNHGAEVSDVAHNTDATGEDHGAAVCDTASRGKCTEHRDSDGDHGTTTTVTTVENHDGPGDDGADVGDDHGGDSNDHGGDSNEHGGGESSGHGNSGHGNSGDD